MRNKKFGPVPQVAYLVYFADGMLYSFLGIVFAPFFNTGHRRRAIFVKSVVESVISLFSYEFFKLLSMLFFKTGYHLEGKILKPGEKVISWSAYPRTI